VRIGLVTRNIADETEEQHKQRGEKAAYLTQALLGAPGLNAKVDKDLLYRRVLQLVICSVVHPMTIYYYCHGGSILDDSERIALAKNLSSRKC